MKKRVWAALLALGLLFELAACVPDTPTGPEDEDFTVRAALGARPDTLDPAYQREACGQTIAVHLFENLLRWEVDEEGQAVLGCGQAERYTVEELYDGSVVYTFTLRRDLKWSDGRNITARDFLFTWQRLFDRENPAAGITGLSMLRGYYPALEEGNLEGLGVAAPDRYTFTVTLDTPCAYFLEVFCAGVMTMPVSERAVRREGWGTDPERMVTNGPYTLETFDDGGAVLVRSDSYHNPKSVGPDRLEFRWDGDWEDFSAGTLDLLSPLSLEEAEEQAAAHTYWRPAPVLSTYTLLLNNEAAPFDNNLVRDALARALDPEALMEAAGTVLDTAASGLVPSGVTERGLILEKEEKPEDDVPQLPPVDGEEEPDPVWDFRAAGNSIRPALPALEDQRAEAARLLAQAGYPGGRGFPAVEYLYAATEQNRLLAKAMQEQWRTVLNIEISIRGVDEEELRSLLLAGDYACAGFNIASSLDDASVFLNRWVTDRPGNLVRSNNRGYDLLIEIAGVTFDTAAREAYLHDAEEILLSACGVIPLFFHGTAYALADGLQGLYRSSTGVFYLQSLRRPPAPEGV